MSNYKKDEELLRRIKRGDEGLVQQLNNQYKEPFKLYLKGLFKGAKLRDVLSVYSYSMVKLVERILLENLKTPLKFSLKQYLFMIGENQFYKQIVNNYAEEEELLNQIKVAGDRFMNQLYYLYEEAFKLFLLRYFRGASEDDVLEVYPVSMAIMVHNIRTCKLKPPLKSTLKTYLFAIGINQFKKRFFDNYHLNTDLTDNFDILKELQKSPHILEMFEHEEQAEKIDRLLNLIGERCKKLLLLYYIEGYSMEAIMHEMGFPSEGAVRKKKHDCLEKLRGLL